MGIEEPKEYIPEEIAEMEKSRTISDAELLKGGEEYTIGSEVQEPVRNPTNEQIARLKEIGLAERKMIEGIDQEKAKGDRIGSIHFGTVADISGYFSSEHTEEPFVSEKILFSREKVELFLRATGDENEIHQTKEGVAKSIFAKKHPNKLIAPGFFTTSILANKNVLWEALTIDEPHETLNLSCSVRWSDPVPVDSEVFYYFKIKKVKKIVSREDSDIKGDWALVEFDTSAHYISENGEQVKCMEASYVVGYIPQ